MKAELTHELWGAALALAEKEEVAVAWDLIGGLTPRTSFEFCMAGSIRSALDGRDQQAAKDLVSQSVALGTQEEVARAHTYLALCYWRAGEIQEALAFSHAAIEGGLTGRDLLCALFSRGTILTSDNQLTEALKCLLECENLFDDVSLVMRGKVHNQRALVLKRLNKLPEAAEEYERAAFAFELSENPALEAVALNNVAALLLTKQQYLKARANVDRAISLFRKLGDRRLGNALDMCAQIEFAYGDPKAAERSSAQAVTMLEGQEPDFLAEALITHGRVLSALGRHGDARSAIERALQLCEALGDRHRAGDACATLLETVPLEYREALRYFLRADELGVSRQRVMKLAVKICRTIEPSIIKEALQQVNGSITKAAAMLKLNHSSLVSRIEKYPELKQYRKPSRVRRWKKKPYVLSSK